MRKRHLAGGLEDHPASEAGPPVGLRLPDRPQSGHQEAARQHGGKTKRKLLALDELEECIPSGEDPAADLEVKELTAAINRFLDGLGYEDRYLFVRRYWYADSVADIADQTHGNVNRYSVRLFRLREKLRKSLQKEGLYR